jgi:transposase-like protein
MVEASGGQIAKVARELKLHDSSLGNWVREAREQAAGAPTAQERGGAGLVTSSRPLHGADDGRPHGSLPVARSVFAT